MRFELIIQDTVKCLICDDPKKILNLFKEYPDYEKAVGFSLKEFVKFETKEEYVNVMGERLSDKMISGKPCKVIGRVRKILDFEYVDTDVLDNLMVRRNKIVHEGYVYEIGLSELETYYNALENLLIVLARALQNINIDVIDKGKMLSNE